MSNSKKINTPDGPGIRLEWPAGSSKYFRERRGTSFDDETSHNVTVTPVLLDSGEVRFYAEHALS
jgi:hypothetical protein